MAPALVVLALVLVYPLARTLYFSTTSGSVLGELTPVGLDNYRQVILDEDFHQATIVTLAYVGASGAITIALAFLLADLLHRIPRFASLLRVVYVYPVVLSTVVASVVFVSVFNPFSGVMRLLPLPFGLNTTNWLQSPTLVLPAIVLFTVWKGLGFYLILFIAGISNISRDLLDAARIDGAGAFQTARHVTVPLLRPVFAFAIIINIVYGFQNFGLVYSLTRGGPNDASQTLPLMIYDEAFKFFRQGYASTIAVSMAFMMAALSLVTLWLVGRERGKGRVQ